MIKWFFTIYVACVIWNAGVWGRMVPYYDLDEDFYSDVRNILEDHLSNKIPGSFDHPREVRGWGLSIPNSQVTGVAVDHDGNPVIFHRGSRFWNYDTFNSTHHLQNTDPIPESVVLTFDKETGEIITSWGSGMFYFPHGICVDSKGNTWLTDIGSHQVYKFPPKSKKPSLVLGEKLQPGDDKRHFCKPTSVVVASSGEFFVADGYCNARIIHFSPDGAFRGQYGHYGRPEETSSLNVPHGLTLKESLDTLCIADRENMRIVCIHAGLTQPKLFGNEIVRITEPNNLRLFDVAFVGNGLLGIGGSEAEGIALGFTANLKQASVIDQWEPIQRFHNPHSITVDEKRGTVYVAEIGPNRVWKFILDAATGENEA